MPGWLAEAIWPFAAVAGGVAVLAMLVKWLVELSETGGEQEEKLRGHERDDRADKKQDEAFHGARGRLLSDLRRLRDRKRRKS